MRDQRGESSGPLWMDGDMLLRVQGAGRESDRIIKVQRPYALVGQATDCDVYLNDQGISARHVYLHLDPRGVYAVDLVTRTGTRLNGTSQMVGWLGVGQSLEIGGRRVDVLRLRHRGAVIEPPPCDADLLADTGPSALAQVTLEPRKAADGPWVLGSELVFLGWSASCGIQVKDSSVARTHCALVRTESGAYLIDLCGHHTWIEDRPVRGASPLHDGELLTIGSAQFTVRIEPAAPPLPVPARPSAALQAELVLPPTRSTDLDILQAPGAPALLNAVPAELQATFMAWMMGALKSGQGELMRRQDEFQFAVAEVLEQMRQDQTSMLKAHVERIERIDRELAELRIEIKRRFTDPSARAPLPPQPSAAPLRIARTSQQEPADSKASTAWLLERASQLEEENRSAWKDLFGRLAPTPRKAT